ncbi:MAG: tetratricopeptide repeat protein [Acidobacteriota bacterium]
MKLVLLLALTLSAFAADPAVTQSQPLLKAKKYDEAITVLAKAHTANPKSAEVTKALADAHLANADSFMNNAALPPNQKYPTALREYRKVLELDKANAKAKDNIGQIEAIYKQMGRPIPQ